MRGGTREGSRRWESERGERGCLKRPRIYARIGQVFNEFLNVVNDAAAPMGDNGVCDVCDVCVCVYSLSLSLSLSFSLFLPSLPISAMQRGVNFYRATLTSSCKPRDSDSSSIRIKVREYENVFLEIDIAAECR